MFKRPLVSTPSSAGAPGALRPPASHYLRPAQPMPSFVAPLRWSWVIGVALLALALFAVIVLVTARRSSLSGVEATVASAETREASEAAAPRAPEVGEQARQAVAAAVVPAFRKAAVSCSAIRQKAPFDLTLTVSERGVLGASIASGPLAGTEAGQCVAERLVGQAVPGFMGEVSTLTVPVTP